jgi:hypothetical protein
VVWGRVNTQVRRTAVRIAVLIIGLITGAILFLQSLTVGGLSDLAQDEGGAASGAIGLFVAFLWLLGCGLVIPVPRVSMVIFAISGLLAFAASGDFADLKFWGTWAFVLAIGSYLGYRGKRKADRKEAERDGLIREALSHRAATSTGD